MVENIILSEVFKYVVILLFVVMFIFLAYVAVKNFMVKTRIKDMKDKKKANQIRSKMNHLIKISYAIFLGFVVFALVLFLLFMWLKTII